MLFASNVSRRMRIQALANFGCAVYMITISLLVTHVGFFHIVPQCFQSSWLTVFLNRLAIWYIFTCTAGNYVTCILTPTSAKKISSVNDSTSLHQSNQKGKGSSNGATTENLRRKKGRESQVGVGVSSGERFCLPCDMHVPVRSHHCYLCQACIIKRDHHCFFMGICIGRENHIYFIFFTLFMGLGTFYGLVLIAKYMNFLYNVQFKGPQTFVYLFFSTFIGLVQGQLPTYRFMGLFVLLYISPTNFGRLQSKLSQLL